MRNVREVVEAAGGKPILYFPARHDHWLVQTGDGWSAHIGGSIGVSTDAQASWWGGRGIGTVPHGLIAAYGGDTALRRAQVRRPLRARHERHRAGRLRERLGQAPRSRSPRRSATSCGACGSTPPTSWPTSRCAACTATTRRRASPPSSSNSCAPSSTRRGYRDVHIVVSGGFTAERIRAFEADGVPVDSYGVGSSLIRGSNDFTADVVMNEGAAGGQGRAGVPPEPAARARPLDRAGRTARARAPVRSSPSGVRWTTNSRWSPSWTGTTSRPPGASCSSSAGGIAPPAAAATLIASNGASPGRPRVPSPTTSVTFSTPAARGCPAPAPRAPRGARRSRRARRASEQRRVVARAGADVEHPLVAAQLSSSHMRATTSGWEIVWPAPIGSGTLSHAPRAARRGRTLARHRGIAASTRSSATCGRSSVQQRSRGASHAIRRPRAHLGERALGVPGHHLDAAHRVRVHRHRKPRAARPAPCS